VDTLPIQTVEIITKKPCWLKSRATAGLAALSLSNSSHLPPIAGSKFVNPVRFAPGRARLATRPLPIGFATCKNTIGTAAVPWCNATAAGDRGCGREPSFEYSRRPRPASQPVRLRRVLVTASLWPRRLAKPVLVLLDHRTKRVTPLRLARSVDFVLFVDDGRHHVVLIENSDHALYIGQQPGSELFATVVVDAEGYGQLDEAGFR
jgi:hypothetical protein